MEKQIQLKQFQSDAIKEIRDAFFATEKMVILKSCTGSGKTIILTHFIDEILKFNDKHIFIWLTPGTGELEEQSKKKMDKYIRGRKTKLLSDVMTSGFEKGDTCFINWELLVNETNRATQEGDFTNIYQHVRNAKNKGAFFAVIIDEEHLNQTVKSKEVISCFDPVKIIRASATPKMEGEFILVNVDEDDVIDAELIKKKIVVNLDVDNNVEITNQVSYLLGKAIEKRDVLESEINKESNERIIPLIIVQIPNENPVILDQVERYFETHNINYENGLLSVWLSNKKINIDTIEKHSDKTVAVIIKQAISTGWDCPRAHILVKLRDNMDETFEIQTIGRIRRMPEARFYKNDILNYCYLYTFDEKYVEEVKKESGRNVLEAITLKLHPSFNPSSFNLKKQLKNPINYGINSRAAVTSIANHFKKEYNLDGRTRLNKDKLEAAGFFFDTNIIKTAHQGSVRKLNKKEFMKLKKLNLIEPLNTHEHGRQFHHIVSELANSIHIQYDEMRVIIRRLFDAKIKDSNNKLLLLNPKELYAFFINNFFLLKENIERSIANSAFIPFNFTTLSIKEEDFTIPSETLFTYDANQKLQKVYKKNVYKGYLSSAEVRSNAEKRFEKYCERSKKIKWVYKNGDKGIEFFSIVYVDAFKKQKLFYPDYIIMANDGSLWIIETKGGFTRAGKSEDIDKFSPFKFAVLKKYLDENNLKGGFVRLDKRSDELCICLEKYDENIQSKNWLLLKEVL